MNKRSLFALLVLCVLVLVACNDDKKPATTSQTTDQQLGPLEWDHDPTTIILRFDERVNEGPPAQLANEIPLCTVWGDGHIVWVNRFSENNEPVQTEILEARLSDEAVRGLIEDVIFTGFYDWESNFLIPDYSNPVIQSISLNLFSEERTVSRYTDWAVNGFARLLEACTQASDSPAQFLPEGVWLTAYEVPYNTQDSYWVWFSDLYGFSLGEVANGQPPRWVTGDLAKELFSRTVLAPGGSYALEDDKAYELAVQVPNITRDSPPPPAP